VCPKVHSVAFRDQYQEENKKKDLGYEDEVSWRSESYLQESLMSLRCQSDDCQVFDLYKTLLDDVDRKIMRGK
jgi:hypothetical protein